MSQCGEECPAGIVHPAICCDLFYIILTHGSAGSAPVMGKKCNKANKSCWGHIFLGCSISSSAETGQKFAVMPVLENQLKQWPSQRDVSVLEKLQITIKRHVVKYQVLDKLQDLATHFQMSEKFEIKHLKSSAWSRFIHLRL